MDRTLIFQWNAQNLLAHGDNLKQFISNKSRLPDVICVQETFLWPESKIKGHASIRLDRLMSNPNVANPSRGGCAIFVSCQTPFF